MLHEMNVGDVVAIAEVIERVSHETGESLHDISAFVTRQMETWNEEFTG